MKKILIIEDEHPIVEISTIVLEHEGYQVYSLTDFVGYENIVNECKADLVLLELNLNGYHGKDICRYIKAHEHLKHTKVVIMSANPDIEIIKTEAGADAFICKPFVLKDLIRTIKASLC